MKSTATVYDNKLIEEIPGEQLAVLELLVTGGSYNCLCLKISMSPSFSRDMN